MKNISSGLFGTFVQTTGTFRIESFDGTVREIILNEPPLWSSWTVLFGICVVCLAILSRKVKAYEVVK
jgi:hypothetical protein